MRILTLVLLVSSCQHHGPPPVDPSCDEKRFEATERYYEDGHRRGDVDDATYNDVMTGLQIDREMCDQWKD